MAASLAVREREVPRKGTAGQQDYYSTLRCVCGGVRQLLDNGSGLTDGEAVQAAARQARIAWFVNLDPAIADGGNPLSPAAGTIASDGRVADGPDGLMATGYSIIKADRIDAGVDMARGCPAVASGVKYRFLR
jgi:hypothetical protein